MTTSPTFNVAALGSYTGQTFSSSQYGAVTISMTYSGSSVALGGAVTLNVNGTSYSGIYEGYSLSGGVEDPLLYVPAFGAFGLLGGNAVGHFSITQASYSACYHTGTHILTERGEVVVEALQIGDVVVTASGLRRPIKWIGRRSYRGRFLAGNSGASPVLIRAGALADGIPARDLRVSPRHALLIDGVLVEAHDLVNGRSICRMSAAEQVDYVHLELETHDAVLAEGAASETFVDDDSRGMFHNAAEYLERYPGEGARAAVYCAPRVTSGPVLQAIRDRFGARAQVMLAA